MLRQQDKGEDAAGELTELEEELFFQQMENSKEVGEKLTMIQLRAREFFSLSASIFPSYFPPPPFL